MMLGFLSESLFWPKQGDYFVSLVHSFLRKGALTKTPHLLILCLHALAS